MLLVMGHEGFHERLLGVRQQGHGHAEQLVLGGRDGAPSSPERVPFRREDERLHDTIPIHQATEDSLGRSEMSPAAFIDPPDSILRRANK